ncbi:hypothetical protein N7462_004996 [Penicillium macrosclerotiorum]|uniref:uncharacterized protein n=1 Tax=Penicillium macrosclerotiorum TaxID=303699 RepID=UPI0025475500|nr:uncharacterized protein N7462_004996 [Penicillium macrosclerotiorum]KAJ5690604.1 hypothetical protein N7462_004996 [Penicillium macrosclerotiorum]
MTSPSTRRLLKESSDLHKSPSPYFTAHPTTDNLHDWHFTLAGPPSPTPYATGLYHGRITFPPTYPLRPPSFRFLTPSGRFEVNREICLSISGHHEETWQPAWGVRTALLAIRSEIMGAEAKGQVGGMEGSPEVRREYARLSRSWTCRECGGSNHEAMQRWWDLCREKGVVVDVEGVEDGSTPAAGGENAQVADADANTNPDTPAHSATETQQSPVQEVPVAPPQAPVAMIVNSEPVASSASPAAVSTSTQAATAPSAAQSDVRPRPTPTTRIPAPTTDISPEPASSAWLDRIIVGIVIALILLITRRVVGVDDL